MSGPISGVYNDAYIAEVYEAYRRDPASVDDSWRQFFRLAEGLGGLIGAPPAPTTVAADPAYLRKVAGAAALVDAIRQYGHMAVRVDPLGSAPSGAAELTPEFHGITEDDLKVVPAFALGFDVGTAEDVVRKLRELYSSNIGFEFAHISEEAEREWFRGTIEHEGVPRLLSDDEKRGILRRLTEVDGLERFIGRAWVNMKRFSIEGTDVLVPMLDMLIQEAGGAGAREVAIAMAHRGRINVLTHILGKPYGAIFQEFEGKHAHDSAESETGDVKYHLGAEGERTLAGGLRIQVRLVPNPSHLEIVNPVLEGVARALQERGDPNAERDESAVVPVCVHGDAAFPGEGIVPETLNLSRLAGYRTGGTVHVIVNNQIGFTTDPIAARSTYYASDPAKGFEIPIVHVNADDIEACIAVVRLAVAYRTRFGKDFLIDLVGYRRHGHNEGDEPTFTQPDLYATIKAHPTSRAMWGERLVRDELVTEADVDALDKEIAASLERVLDDTKKGPVEEEDAGASLQNAAPAPATIETGVSTEQLAALNEQLLAWPTGFTPHQRLAKQLERRRDAVRAAGDQGGVDWGHAESLAFASLLTEGVGVRITGQDVERGTFSHRHAVLHDVKSGGTYTPLQHLPKASARFEIYNSPLSEMAVLGFEYGYSTQAEHALVLWEAQFGDFVNVAQPIIDQFLAADRAKWGQDSGLVLLLPHGYEGQGPEHSSARLERFLQLCAENNMRVAYPSTPAQYFHVLRRQAKLDPRRPLILMQPKSLLRLPQAASRLEDMASGGFRVVIDDAAAAARRDQITRLVFCTGKIYYELLEGLKKLTESGRRPDAPQVALVRVEELYPWPSHEVTRIVDQYASIDEIVWVQEEPKNMGAWSYVAPRLRASAGNAMVIRHIGRPERASPAEGYLVSHNAEQKRIIAEVLEGKGIVPPRTKAAARVSG
jgi:2-oxoglutarate dehydrogenase E1 component